MTTLSRFGATASLLFAATTLLAVLSAGVAIAAAEPAFEAAFVQFGAASTGDSAAIEKAADAFDALLQAEPANPVLMAYAGAATAMRAGTTVLPWKKMNYAEDGLALIDKSLALLTPAHDGPIQHHTPGVLEVKLVAANTFLGVPGFMNRAARGSKLLAELLAHPLLETAPLPFKGAVWMRAAALAAKEQHPDEARRLLQLVVSQGAPQAEAAKARLKELPA